MQRVARDYDALFSGLAGNQRPAVPAFQPAVTYSLQSGGKRIRSQLLCAAGHAITGEPTMLDALLHPPARGLETNMKDRE